MKKYRNIYYILVSFGFLYYGALFIWKTSFIAIDGLRYFTVADDALITFRYGWNLSRGLGLVWNVGEYVEGITSLLWTSYAGLLSFLLPKRYVPF